MALLVRSAFDSAEYLVVDIHQAPGEHRVGIQPGVDRVQHFAVNFNLAGPLPEGLGGEVGGFLCDKLVKLHSNHFISEPLPASLRNHELDCLVLRKLLENRQAGDVGAGQLNGTQRLAVVKPAEELSDLCFRHSLIIVDREVVVLDFILHSLRQLGEIHSAEVLHAPVFIHNGRGIGSQGKLIMEKFADGI